MDTEEAKQIEGNKKYEAANNFFIAFP
jgi:hypothetical protein